VPVGLRLVIDQVVPFHCSISVLLSKFAVVELPTAKQLVVLGHAMPSRAASTTPLGFGVLTIDHAVPFQCSTNVLPPAEGLT
jgi:hypothetical protein